MTPADRQALSNLMHGLAMIGDAFVRTLQEQNHLLQMADGIIKRAIEIADKATIEEITR